MILNVITLLHNNCVLIKNINLFIELQNKFLNLIEINKLFNHFINNRYLNKA